MTKESGHSDATTQGIRVRVGAQYLPDQSEPDVHRYTFAYRVILSNEGDSAAKLLSRHWIVCDADNNRRDIRGPGVVGEFPRLAPGESFEYTSGCPLATKWGTMEGTYRMQRDDGEEFDVRIARFFLAPSTAPISSAEGSR